MAIVADGQSGHGERRHGRRARRASSAACWRRASTPFDGRVPRRLRARRRRAIAVARRRGEVGLLAGDLLDELPPTIARLQAEARRDERRGRAGARGHDREPRRDRGARAPVSVARRAAASCSAWWASSVRARPAWSAAWPPGSAPTPTPCTAPPSSSPPSTGADGSRCTTSTCTASSHRWWIRYSCARCSSAPGVAAVEWFERLLPDGGRRLPPRHAADGRGDSRSIRLEGARRATRGVAARRRRFVKPN